MPTRPSKPGEAGIPAVRFKTAGEPLMVPPKRPPVLQPEDIGPPQHELVDSHEEQRAEAQLTRRQAKVGHPGKLSGSEAETYVERKKVELSVDAIVELEYALKYGTSGERERARDRILDANGHGKRDRTSQAANLIVINMGSADGTKPPLPYEVVEAKLLPAKS